MEMGDGQWSSPCQSLTLLAHSSITLWAHNNVILLISFFSVASVGLFHFNFKNVKCSIFMEHILALSKFKLHKRDVRQFAINHETKGDITLS